MAKWHNNFNWWIIPITFAVIGWFGIFWTINLADAEIDININHQADNNTKALYDAFNKSIDDDYFDSKSCIKGCNYAFERIQSTPNTPLSYTTAIGDFPKTECKQFCEVNK